MTTRTFDPPATWYETTSHGVTITPVRIVAETECTVMLEVIEVQGCACYGERKRRALKRGPTCQYFPSAAEACQHLKRREQNELARHERLAEKWAQRLEKATAQVEERRKRLVYLDLVEAHLPQNATTEETVA